MRYLLLPLRRAENAPELDLITKLMIGVPFNAPWYQMPRFVRDQSIRHRPPRTRTQNNRFVGVPRAWW